MSVQTADHNPTPAAQMAVFSAFPGFLGALEFWMYLSDSNGMILTMLLEGHILLAHSRPNSSISEKACRGGAPANV
jgi:hypothetical protein